MAASPSGRESEIAGVKMKDRNALESPARTDAPPASRQTGKRADLRQGLTATRDEYLCFLKHSTGGATNSDSCFCVRAVFDERVCVRCIKLAAGEGMKPTENARLFTATHQKNFRVLGWYCDGGE